MTPESIDNAILSLAGAVTECGKRDPSGARAHVKEAAKALDVFLDATGADGPGSLRVVQEHALIAAKALCDVRSPVSHGNPSNPDSRERRADAVFESFEQARSSITSAWEVLCGRRPV